MALELVLHLMRVTAGCTPGLTLTRFVFSRPSSPTWVECLFRVQDITRRSGGCVSGRCDAALKKFPEESQSNAEMVNRLPHLLGKLLVCHYLPTHTPTTEMSCFTAAYFCSSPSFGFFHDKNQKWMTSRR